MARGESPGDPCYKVGDSHLPARDCVAQLVVPRHRVAQWVALYNEQKICRGFESHGFHIIAFSRVKNNKNITSLRACLLQT